MSSSVPGPGGSELGTATGTVQAVRQNITARTNERAVAQQAFASDPKYKKYTQQVEKCLNSFDNVHEWADCIAFLKQLLKTFQSYMQFKEIPRKLVVSKRLAQCLNPALPTGVHQRALDVYAHILAVLGSEGLKRDLALWSSGLFPFFEYAATSVKPTLLNLYDTHYLPLQAGLRPVMKSFILALLPGLEEETGEFFEKVLSLLDRLSETVSQSFFFQNIWLVMLTTPSARGTSLNFLSRRLPKLNTTEDFVSTIGRDIGLMIRAFAAALEDENLLVRRGALDLLLQSLRADSAAIKMAQAEDRTILMRAATSVVLRRDLSLNRRLYTWLLGPDEKSDHQITYLREHSLELLSSTLKDEMFSPSSDYSESRPFKIFISLLDKWEIGAALTEKIVYDSFKAIKRLIESGSESDGGGTGKDVEMTASTLYEAVEPEIIWQQLLAAVFLEITGDGAQFEAIKMVSFILETFSQDEEVQTIHLPIAFSAIIDILNFHVQNSIEKKLAIPSPSIREALLLEEAILRHIPHAALMQHPELTGDIQAASISQRPYLFACSFYGISPIASVPTLKTSSSETIPFVAAFQNFAALSVSCAHSLMEASGSGAAPLREVFSQTLLILDRLIGRLGTPIRAAWDPEEWLSVVLRSVEHETATFTVVDRVIALVISLHRTKSLEPRLSIDERSIMFKMVNKLLKYLRPDCSVYHVRAVNLIWSLESATKRSHVESIVSRTMASPANRNAQESYEAFGVLWRLTEDNLLPGFRFKVPMMLVLDTLKNDDPSLRRIGETWMRCSLKSYLRVLDPILFELLDPSIRRIPTTTQIRGRELQGFLYERSFDQRYTNHLLEMLLSIVRFGGQGFAKTARTTVIKRSHHGGLIERVESASNPEPDTSYLDVLVDVLLRFLQSEPKSGLGVTMQPNNAIIQSTTVDLLQAIVARGEIDAMSVETIEAIVIGKLYFCVHMKRLDLQNKLLHLLHSLISASTSAEDQQLRKGSGKQRQLDNASEDTSSQQDNSQEPRGRSYPVNPLLIQTLMDGITIPTNRPVLQHWLDFILMAVPQFQPTLHAVVTPLNDCICRQLHASLQDILQASTKDPGYTEDTVATSTDAELIMLLNSLERLILLSLAYTSENNTPEDDNISTEKSGQENSGLLGYVSNVFSSDNGPNSVEDQLTARSPGYRSLHEGIRVLFAVWSTLAWSNPQVWSSKDESLSLIYTRTRVRCRRVLEHLFRVQSAEVFESIIDCWNKELLNPKIPNNAAFELIDVLIANAQNAVHMICESISCRISGVSERTKKQAINPDLSDAVLFKFLEQYLQRLEGPLALQVWGRFLQLAKEIIGNARDFKVYNFLALRCSSVLAVKITQTTAMEDRRVRKELQETVGKLLDACVAYAGRSFDQGSWIRRSTKDSIVPNGRESPGPRDVKMDEKTDGSTLTLPDMIKPGVNTELISQINQFLSATALPNLRRFLMDNDKVAASCSNIVYYIVNPAMKGKSRPMDVDAVIMDIIREMSKIPPALKAWRTPVTDLLNDNRLFNCNWESAAKWKPIVKSLFDADKTAFPELLAKVATAPSANIFTNREYEMLLRSLNLRRLSFVLFAGDKNHFITQLPTIQEKLVDILRNVSAPIVQSEVYLCIRVLLCRLSPHNLTSFWPVILTELYRLFEQVMTSLPSDGSEDLQLILSASKCLDLLLTLQTDEFQIHQWIFITDTVDAVYPPDDWFPEAMMDQLAEIAGSLPATDARETPSNGVTSPGINFPSAFPKQQPARRPLLNSLRQIDSIRDLVPFFSNVSISSYESVYASGGTIDWEAIELGLTYDMFDGQ